MLTPHGPVTGHRQPAKWTGRLGSLAFRQCPAKIFVQNARDQRLIRKTFLDGSSLNAAQVAFGQSDVDPLVLMKGIASSLSESGHFRFLVFERSPFSTFERWESSSSVSLGSSHIWPSISSSRSLCPEVSFEQECVYHGPSPRSAQSFNRRSAFFPDGRRRSDYPRLWSRPAGP